MGLLDRRQAAQRYGLLSPDVMSLIQSGGPRVAPAPAQPPRRERVSGFRVLDRVLGGSTISEGLDAERARLETEALRPQMRQRMEANRIAAAQMGPAALIAFDNNPEAFAESVGMQFRPVTTAAGSQTNYGPSPFAFRVEQPTFAESGDQTLRRTSAGVAPVYTRTAPSIKENIDRSVAETGRINATNPVNVAPGGQLRDPRTGALIAQGANRIFSAADASDLVDENGNPIYQNQRDAPQTNGQDTEAMRKDRFNTSRLQNAASTIERLESSGLDASTAGLQPWDQTSRAYLAAGEEWVDSLLRMTTGAQAPQSEIDAGMRTYFPQPGDGLAVRRQKAEARANAQRAAQERSRAAGAVSASPDQVPADVSASSGVEDVVNPRTGERRRWNGSAWVRAQ